MGIANSLLSRYTKQDHSRTEKDSIYTIPQVPSPAAYRKRHSFPCPCPLSSIASIFHGRPELLKLTQPLKGKPEGVALGVGVTLGVGVMLGKPG
jgi:hypothetical protein